MSLPPRLVSGMLWLKSQAVFRSRLMLLTHEVGERIPRTHTLISRAHGVQLANCVPSIGDAYPMDRRSGARHACERQRLHEKA
jgi:hypothetical protein